MAMCQVCGKIGHSGNTVSHSKRRVKTRFLPNIQRATLDIDGSRYGVKLCTRCLRTYHKLPK
ncbi:MAG: rpmB [Dehalococcoidia bacterium]|nr:rpmB [Dehalococcoidia bacterium]